MHGWDTVSRHAPTNIKCDWRGTIQVGVRDTSLSLKTRHKVLFASEEEDVSVHLQRADPHEQISEV